MAYIGPTFSVVAFQSDPTKLQASVTGRVDIGNLSQASGSVVAFLGNSTNASVIVVGGTAGNSSVMLTPGINTIGSVAALQGTNPWVVQLSSGSVITTGGNSSVQIVGQTPPASVSGVGTFNINPVGSGSIIATLVTSSVTALQGTNPWVVGNSSVQVVGIMPTQSVMVVPGIGVLGSVATLQGTNPWVVGNSSVVLLNGLNVIGSVAVLQGTSPWITTTQASSIVGTYAEDSASADGDKGIFVLGVRNDAIASFVSADKDYGAVATDSAGRMLIKPFAANEGSIYSHASVVNGGDSGSVLVLAGAGTGLRNYITDWTVANTGSVTTLVTFTEGGGSVLGRTIAPAGGGSNSPGAMMPIANIVPNQPINMVTGTAASVVYVTMRGYKAP